jgi:hypothetical protein
MVIDLLAIKYLLKKGVKVEAAIINSTYGAVYLSKESEIMEGAIIRGGLALGEGSSIKMGQNSMAPIPLIPIVKSVEK